MASWSVVGSRGVLSGLVSGHASATANGSFGCAQDDETGMAVEAVGVHRAVAV